jgi:hypothetical protein
MTSEARFLVNAIVVPLGVLLPIATSVFAWFKGGPADRIGGALFGIAVLATVGFELITGQSTPVVPELLLDTTVATGFLGLAIRFNSLWLGAAMIVAGIQLAVHATHLTDGEDPMFAGFNLYAASLNLISLVICLILIAGTMASIRARVAGRMGGGEPQPPLQLRARRPVRGLVKG